MLPIIKWMLLEHLGNTSSFKQQTVIELSITVIYLIGVVTENLIESKMKVLKICGIITKKDVYKLKSHE